MDNSMDIQNELFIDFKHLLGNPWSVTEKALATYGPCIKQAARDVSELRRTGKGRDGGSVLFPHLPYLLEENVLISDEEKNELLSLKEKAKGYDAVISIGIGGSYLGNQVLFDLFCGPYWNQLTKEERWLSSVLFCRTKCGSSHPCRTFFLYFQGGKATEGPSDEGTVPGHFQIWHNH